MPIILFRKLPPLFYASLGALLGLLITAFVLSERSGQKSRELLQDFGETVVAMAAREVAGSAMQEDLVSMHAVMQTLVGRPRIQMATVHSVEQQLLVQAGQVRNNVEHQVFSAPVAVDDSVAGHVSIAVASEFPGDAAVRWTIAATAFLLGLMVLLTLYETRGVAWYFPRDERDRGERQEEYFAPADAWDEPELEEVPQQPGFESAMSPPDLDDELPPTEPDPETYADTRAESDTDEPERQWDAEREDDIDEESDNGGEEPPPREFKADLILALSNYARLQQQLNSERFSQLTQSFDDALEEVLNLYGGKLVAPPHNQNIYCIVFSSRESGSEAAFRAACSAYLMQQKTLQSKIRFNLLAAICPPDADVKLPVNQTGIYLQGLEMDGLLKTRLNYVALEEDRYQLVGFNAPFASLLERQEKLVVEV